MRRFLIPAAALVFVTALVVWGAGYDVPAKARRPTLRPLGASELVWLAHLSRWEDAQWHADRRAADLKSALLSGQSDDVHAVDSAFRRAGGCSASLWRQVGPPPSARLGRGWAGYRRVCSQTDRAARAEITSRHGHPELFAAAAEGWGRADLVWRQARQAVAANLLSNRPLPRRGGLAGSSRIEPRLSRAATAIVAGNPVEIRCWSSGDWLSVMREERAWTNGRLSIDRTAGFALKYELAADLNDRDCLFLARLVYAGYRPLARAPRDRLAGAVELLAHETQHLVSPEGTEAETECAAVQTTERVARLLGARAGYARLLAQVYARDLYPDMPAAYWSPDCRNGGRLDQRPGSTRWP